MKLQIVIFIMSIVIMGMGHPERIPGSEFESSDRDLMSKTTSYSQTSFSATEIPRQASIYMPE